MTKPQNNITAVVLSGGGAHGAYEVGVLKALLGGITWMTSGRPLVPDILTGTSIGAFHAAVLTARLEAEDAATVGQYLEDFWLNTIPQDGNSGHNHIYRFRGNPAELLHWKALLRRPTRSAARLGNDAAFFAQDWLQRGVNFFSSNGTLAQRSVGLIDLSTLISREPTERLLRATLDLEAIRQSRRQLFIATTDWQKGQLSLFRNADMTDEAGNQIVLASSAIPGLFPPVEFGGRVYVDGGLTLNAPLLPAFVLGTPAADTAHVIYLDPETEEIPLDPLHSTIDTIGRLTTIVLSRSVEADMQIAHRVNRGLALMDEVSRGMRLDRSDMRGLAESASYLIDGIGGRLPDSPKTIHRYRPSHYLGGTLSLVNFSRARVAELIDLGYHDALNHNCQVSHCVLPGSGMQ